MSVHIIDHPLLKHKLGYLRDKNTRSDEFRRITREISKYVVYEATKDYQLEEYSIETPLAPARVQRIKFPPVVVSIMRAGNGMIDSVLEELPFACAGHIGIYRDKFIKNTVEYYFKIPENSKGRPVLLLDPLLATGDTIIASVDRLKQYEVGEIRILTILASKRGVDDVLKAHPDLKIYSLELESEMNEKGYLIPGLGDAGDRLFNTY